MKRRMPSMNDSSLPVETSSTRRPSTGWSCSASATPSSTATADRLSLAPGETGERAISAMAAAVPRPNAAPVPSSRREPASAPSAVRIGPATVGHMIGG
jgi:hypothetical protein